MGTMTMARIARTIIKAVSFDLPPNLLERLLCSGNRAIAIMTLHKMMLAKGYMIIRHQATISKRIKRRIVVS
jgi:hypothetical protein